AHRDLPSFPTRRSSDLMEAGAAEVIQPEQEAASTLIRHALERLSLPRDRVLAYLNRYRGAMESVDADREGPGAGLPQIRQIVLRSEEHTSELQSRSDLV